jgi:histone H1/5
MGDIYISRNEDGELTHSAAGTTWQKKGAAYISKLRKNGKWVYIYASNKAGQAGRAVSTGAANVANAVSTAAGNANRAARSAVASSKVNPDVMSTRLRKKTRKNIAKGKARVNAILERLRESAAATRTEINKKARAARTQATIRKTQAERAAAEKKRKAANRKKYAAQAKAQRHTKRVIASEQAIGKVKHTIKNARSGKVNGYYRNKTAKPVSKNVDKKNAGKKR